MMASARGAQHVRSHETSAGGGMGFATKAALAVAFFFAVLALAWSLELSIGSTRRGTPPTDAGISSQ
jgi:hypothetical protein